MAWRNSAAAMRGRLPKFSGNRCMGRGRSVSFSQRAGKAIEAMNGRGKAHLREAFVELSVNPLLGKGLKGEFEGLRVYRVGPCCIVYRISSRRLEAVYLEHRKGLFR